MYMQRMLLGPFKLSSRSSVRWEHTAWVTQRHVFRPKLRQQLAPTQYTWQRAHLWDKAVCIPFCVFTSNLYNRSVWTPNRPSRPTVLCHLAHATLPATIMDHAVTVQRRHTAMCIDKGWIAYRASEPSILKQMHLVSAAPAKRHVRKAALVKLPVWHHYFGTWARALLTAQQTLATAADQLWVYLTLQLFAAPGALVLPPSACRLLISAVAQYGACTRRCAAVVSMVSCDQAH